MQVTHEQRERAENFLQEAYADGRISEDEFDHRIGQVISAADRAELNQAFYGLVEVPTASRALDVHSAYQPMVRADAGTQQGTAVAGLAHFSVFFIWLLGPGLVYALSSPGTYARREAAKSFNFQLISSISIAAGGILSAALGAESFDFLLGLMVILWFVLTVVGGVKAFQGKDWRNPVQSVIPLKVLKEK
jgi:uncharacterized Tic20 family protein